MPGVKLVSLVVTASVLVVAVDLAAAIDLTTFDSSAQMTEQGRVSRYTTILGCASNHTPCHLDGTPDGDPTSPNTYLGAYDYTSYPGSLPAQYDNWWRICDGVSDSTGAQPSSYNWRNDDADPLEQWIGYRFKRPASISEINWTNYILPGGGTFLADLMGGPRVEVLADGPMEGGHSWTEIEVTGLENYDSSFAERINRYYTIAPVGGPTAPVWGVRLIGDTQGGGANDTNGFVATGELQISGTSSITQTIDLGTNLLQNDAFASPIYADYVTYPPGSPLNIMDGNVLTQQGFFSETEAGPDWVGVLFGSGAQSDVAAVGLTQRMAADGGWFKPDTMKVQYLPQGADYTVEENWVDVTGLDMGRWEDMEPEVATVAVATGRGYRHAELLTFDTIDEAISGIRIYGDSEGTWGGKGFVAIAEFEVFAGTGYVPPAIPGDTDDDGDVDADDAKVVANHWGQTGLAGGAAVGDFNGDGTVDAADASILAANWGATAGESAVPEPSTVVLLLVGWAMTVLRRRSR